MKEKYGFIEFESLKEFNNWFRKQKITRTITRLQVHETACPDYSIWKNTDLKKWGDNAPLNRTQSLDDYGKTTWGSKDSKGHYIAQHFTIFPNGHITTGRDLNSTPIGIKGWNTAAICCEIYGNFDKGCDTMTKAQKEAVLGFYAICSDELDIPISTTYIRPHAWFTSDGTYLGDYSAKKSRKTCPGTNFFGCGNTKSAFINTFLPAIKAFDLSKLKSKTETATEEKLNKRMYTTGSVNFRKGCSKSSAIIQKLSKNTEVFVLEQASENWYHIKYMGKTGYMSKKYLTEVRPDEVISDTNEQPYTGFVKFKQDLNVRTTPDWDAKPSEVCKEGTVLTIVAKVLPVGSKSYMYKTKSDLYVTVNEKYVTYLKTI